MHVGIGCVDQIVGNIYTYDHVNKLFISMVDIGHDIATDF